MNLAEVLAQQGYAGNDPFPSNVRQPQPDELATALADIGVGIPANLAGLPVDLASALIRPFGYNVPPEQTVGSTEWFQSRAGRDPNSAASMLSAYVSPDPLDALKLGGDVGLAMTLFHGSPHKFDRFSMDKIGTGEGAQAYGHGLYFAESPGTAMWYRDKLAGIDYEPGITLPPDENSIAARIARMFGDDGTNWDRGSRNIDEVAQKFQVGAVDKDGIIIRQMPDGSRFVATEGGWDIAAADTGQLYEVDIPDEAIDKMLDWDKPLSEQPEYVRNQLQKLGINSNKDPSNFSDDELYGAVGGYAKGLGADADIKGVKFYKELAAKLGSDKAASDALRELGIPGIRYLDGTSRSAGEGTRNFVVFDENLITPLTRNGEPIKGAARAAQKSDTSYRGLHSAPEPQGQNSLDNLADIFPDDLYSPEGARYYGHGDMTLDGPTVNIIREMKGSPNKTVTIYRAVPYEKSPAEELESLDAAMSQYMKRGNIPDDYKDAFSGGPWYDKAWDRREELRKIVESGEQSSTGTIGINAGDWVTINKRYAKEHGEAHLGGKFKIVSKKVKAKDLHTDGNSIHEWGYNPK